MYQGYCKPWQIRLPILLQMGITVTGILGWIPLILQHGQKEMWTRYHKWVAMADLATSKELEPVARTRECHTAPAHSVLSLGALRETSSPSQISIAAETLSALQDQPLSFQQTAQGDFGHQNATRSGLQLKLI